MEEREDFDPVAWINTPRWQASRLGLERVADLLERMGRPQDELRFVHVAGTNGKGSTCAYMASVLQAAGYRVGLFTSPFIECFEERIRVDGVNISAEELARAVAAVRPCAEAIEVATGDHPTEFELMMAVALEHFRTRGCDIVVLEVGLGGRLDATNVIEAPEVSVICRIGLDHTDLLGDTLAAVAGEKAGIVKPGCPVVSWPQEPEALAVVEAAARERGCELTVPDFSQLTMEPLAAVGAVGSLGAGGAKTGKDAPRAAVNDRGLRRFSYRGASYLTRLLGSYQPANAALAIETTEVLRRCGWDISEEALFAGIAAARWPGRFEVAGLDPLTIVDGGHNPQGAQALADSLADMLGDGGLGSIAFVVGVLADKDYPSMIRAVLPWARSFTTYTPSSPRALGADELATFIGGEASTLMVRVAESPADAMAAARESAGAAGIVVAFGTLYAISEVKAGLRR